MSEALALSRPQAPQRRVRRHACHYLYCRKVRGRKYQARVWLGKDRGGSLNLGLYETEWECWRAVKAWLQTGELPAGVLPKYVFRREDGLFGARVRTARMRWELGPFEEPVEASAAMNDVVSHLAVPRMPPLPKWLNALKGGRP